ncbi:MAG: DUF2716 domain-containing protein [bacterium]|nr:DUF2716 domain-containing protein [bacterium]
MHDSGWAEFEPHEYDQLWTAFYSTFDFRASTDSDMWPGIREPSPSVTIDLTPIVELGDAQFVAATSMLDLTALYAFTAAWPADQRLAVLDWQHPGYWFWPHAFALTMSNLTPAEWRVPVFPNGDYYIFITEDMRMGTFGHPWEQTLCIFGDSLIAALAEPLSQWLPVKRRQQAP